MELRNNARVRLFLRAAAAHEEAARLLLSRCSPNAASTLCGEVIYLSGYVAECGLKAVLLNWIPDSRHEKTMASFKTPKGVGHDLEKLRNAIIRAGCQVPTTTTSQVRLLAASWFTGMRYEGRRYSYEDAERLCEAGRGVLDWVKGD